MKNTTKRRLPTILFWLTVITTPIFIIDIIVMTVYYVDKPWWGYLVSSVAGFLLGAILCAAEYSYKLGNRKITFWGIPFPALVSDGIGNGPSYGFIVNPIYYMLLINVLYLHFDSENVSSNWHTIILFLIFLGALMNALQSPKE